MSDPYGNESRGRTQAAHWVAYQGSSYPDSGSALLPGESHRQPRELEFHHYVEVEDLRRDYQACLLLHEWLMAILAGFCPPGVPGVASPLKLVGDGLISSRSEGETLYRYRGQYKITCNWRPADVPGLLDVSGLLGETGDGVDLFVPEALAVGIFRSPVEQVGESPVSPKFTDLEVENEP